MTGLEPFAPTLQLISRPLDVKLNQSTHNCKLASGGEKPGFSQTAYDVDTHNYGGALPPKSKFRVIKDQSNELFSKKPRKYALKKNLICKSGCYTFTKVENAEQTSLRASTESHGRSYTISNVGNKGKIYLRPVIHPSNKRYPLPFETCQSRPSIDVLSSRDTPVNPVHRLRSTTSLKNHVQSINAAPPSTMFAQPHEKFHAYSSSEKTPAEGQHSERSISNTLCKSQNSNTLQILTPLHEIRSSNRSSTSSATPNWQSSRRHSDACLGSCLIIPTQSCPLNPQTVEFKNSFRKSATIPETFDTLTLKPLCDHPSIVQYTVDGKISAATPARLVAEITSPTLVDYEFLSDFFLTFRLFLKTADLMHMLIARLEWSLLRIDTIGTIVSVRTFVAIRHWILNYFSDDFLEDRELRKLFCHLINDFVSQVYPYPQQFKVPLKILGELKKCWRRVCVLHWESSEITTDEEILNPISPGGIDSQNFSHSLHHLDKNTEKEKEKKYNFHNHSIFMNFKRISECREILTDPIIIENYTFLSPLINTSHIISESPKITANKQSKRSQKYFHRNVRVDDPRLRHIQSKTSILEKGSSMVKLSSKSNKKYEQLQQKIPGPKNVDNNDAKQIQKELNKNHRLSLSSNPGSIGKCGFLTSRRPLIDIMSPLSPNKVPIINHNSSRFLNTPELQKNLVANSGSSVRKLIDNVCRVFAKKTDHVFGSLQSQKCFPDKLLPRSRGTTQQNSNVDPPHSRAASLLNPSYRIDILSVEVAKELEDAAKDFDTKYIRPWTQSCFIENRDNNSTSYLPTTQFEPIAQSSNTAGNIKTSSQAISPSKSAFLNDSSTSRSFVLSGFSYYPSVDAFAIAYMRPSGAPTTPIAFSEIFSDTCGKNKTSTKHEKGDKSLSCEGTPSLVVDSHSSVEEEKLSFYDKNLEENEQATTEPSSKTGRSNHLCDSYHSSLTEWTSEQSSRASTFSEANLEGNGHLSNPTSIPLCLRPLRRRPGGYLRTSNNHNITNYLMVERRKSTGSCPTVSTSRSNQKSCHLGDTNCILSKPEKKERASSTRQNSENLSRKYISIFGSHLDIHSSFEKKVQLLSQLPDDTDEGTAESALLKLEGKFEKVQNESVNVEQSCSSMPTQSQTRIYDFSNLSSAVEEKERHHNRSLFLEATLLRRMSSFHIYNPTLNQMVKIEQSEIFKSQENIFDFLQTVDPSNKIRSDEHISSFRYGQSENLGYSTQRCLSNRHTMQYPIDGFQFVASSPQISELSLNTSLRPTLRRIEAYSSKENIRHEMRCNDTFLDMESDGESDSCLRSPDASMYGLYHSKKRFTSETSNSLLPIQTNSAMGEILNSPPRNSFPIMRISQGLKASYKMRREKNIFCSDDRRVISELSVSESKVPINIDEVQKNYRGASLQMNPLGLHRISHSQEMKNSSHLPFILGFDSDTLAQQFTLIEKEFISEINWKELVEMKWKEADFEVASWTSYLNLQKSTHGVQAFITRFNLMIKWVISECVLTHDLMERVSCLTKFIHIADKCRKYRNFATMTQIIIALTSEHIVYLAKTWIHVATTEIQTLQELAALVFSFQSSQTLQTEMESADMAQGCIPYIQIYTRELLKNYNLPLKISNSIRSDMLINFEKCRTNAAIIKNLLRLLEASHNYQFPCIKSVYERCYWIAALSDTQIISHKRFIQDSDLP